MAGPGPFISNNNSNNVKKKRKKKSNKTNKKGHVKYLVYKVKPGIRSSRVYGQVRASSPRAVTEHLRMETN